MANLKQFHDPQLSLWQSAVDEVAAKRGGAGQAQGVGMSIGAALGARPDISDPMVLDAAQYCGAIFALPEPTSMPAGVVVPAGPIVAEGVGSFLSHCSKAALLLAKARILGDQDAIARYEGDLAKFGDCDPGYSEAAAQFAAYYKAAGKQPPYVVYKDVGDFVYTDKLPVKAKVAVVGDWGTGQDAAKLVLRQIANKNPDVVIHLGDIYYSGTEFEVTNYFFNPWCQILGLPNPKITTFSLPGNHDYYSGGVAYFNMIKKLGQEASYFCLRNDAWQLIGIDTGLHDHSPVGGGPTQLEDSELAWLKDKIATAGNRKTVLLSHHQLFTAYDAIAGNEVNTKLYPQLADILPQIALWIWGHEHAFVVYQAYRGLARGRCLGHGAFPVGQDEARPKASFPDVPLIAKNAQDDPLSLGVLDGVFTHGYALIELNGASATVSYYQHSDEDTPMYVETI
jgi:hypothetical protein